MKEKIFTKGFFWKLTENYLNAIMVLVLVALIMESVMSGDVKFVFLAIVWVVLVPFLGTFIDLKSNKSR
jgi:hypothetical protein